MSIEKVAAAIKKLSEKKNFYSRIFAASFFVYGANVILFFEGIVIDMLLTSFFLIIYDIIYILFLRRSDNVSFGRAAARTLLYASWGLFLVTAHMFGSIFVQGISERMAFFGQSGGETVYGFRAWTCDGAGFRRVFFLYPSLIGILYNVIYFIVTKLQIKKQAKEKRIWLTE